MWPCTQLVFFKFTCSANRCFSLHVLECVYAREKHGGKLVLTIHDLHPCILLVFNVQLLWTPTDGFMGHSSILKE